MSGAEIIARNSRSAEGRAVRAPRPPTGRAGRVLAGLSLVPSLLVTGWLLAAVPLALAGAFRPALVVPLAVLAAVAVLVAGLRLLGQAPAVLAPWWSPAAVGAIAAGLTVFTALTHAEDVILRRDAGAYAQIGFWLAHHGSVLAQAPTAAFGGSSAALGFASLAFYQVGDQIVPMFMTGWPTVLAAADWAGGWSGLLIAPAVVSGCAVLAVGGLAARLVGARWAPLAALLTALAWPVLHAAQTTLSEPLALLLLAAGVCLLVDWIGVTRESPGLATRSVRWSAFATGLVLTIGESVRLDFGVDFALILPVVGWLWSRRSPGVLMFLGGALLGAAVGVADSVTVARSYLGTNAPSVVTMLALLAVLLVATVVAVPIARRWGPAIRTSRWWQRVPVWGAVVVVVVAAGLVIRPYVLVDHSNTDPGVRAYTGFLQGLLGLPLDGTRSYAEQSLWWVSWYLGWPLLAGALLGAVVMTHRALAGRAARWAPVLLGFLGSAVLTLLHPGITPDHPFADRRLVVEVIPAAILLATAGIAAITGRVGTRRGRTIAGLALLAAYLVPVALATVPVAGDRTEQGELGAITQVCQTLTGNDSMVLLDTLWLPVVRGQCGLPAAGLAQPDPAALSRAVAGIRSAGRIPVVAASDPDELTELGLDPILIVDLNTRQDQQQLITRPDGTAPLSIEFWLVRPAP